MELTQTSTGKPIEFGDAWVVYEGVKYPFDKVIADMWTLKEIYQGQHPHLDKLSAFPKKFRQKIIKEVPTRDVYVEGGVLYIR